MYILTANQNARVIMIIYYSHCDWLNLCAHETTQSVRSDFLASVKMVQLVDVLSLGYICPDHRTIFRSAIFSTIFRHRRRSWATTYVLTIHTGIVRFFDLPFVDVLIQKRKPIVRQSYVSADST